PGDVGVACPRIDPVQLRQARELYPRLDDQKPRDACTWHDRADWWPRPASSSLACAAPNCREWVKPIFPEPRASTNALPDLELRFRQQQRKPTRSRVRLCCRKELR